MTATIDRETFLAERRKGIGGSDVAALLTDQDGKPLDKNKTPYQLWLEKTGQQKDEVKNAAALRRGNFLEGAILDRYRAEVKPAQFDLQVPFAQGKDGWQRGNMDARAIMSDGIKRTVECKTVNRNVFRSDWGDPWSDEVPDRALCQGLWYANLDDSNIVDFAVMVVPDDPDEVLGLTAAEVVEISAFHIYQVDRRPKLEAFIVERAHDFWFNHCVAGIAPDPLSADDVDLMHPHHIDGEVVVADDQLLALLEQYDAVCTQQNKGKALREHLRERLLIAAGGAEAFVNASGTPLLTIKTQERAGHVVSPSKSRTARFTKWWKKLQPKN